MAKKRARAVTKSDASGLDVFRKAQEAKEARDAARRENQRKAKERRQSPDGMTASERAMALSEPMQRKPVRDSGACHECLWEAKFSAGWSIRVWSDNLLSLEQRQHIARHFPPLCTDVALAEILAHKFNANTVEIKRLIDDSIDDVDGVRASQVTASVIYYRVWP